MAEQGDLSSPETDNILCNPFGNPLFDFAVPKITPRYHHHQPTFVTAKTTESTSSSSQSHNKSNDEREDDNVDEVFVNNEVENLDPLPLTEVRVYDKSKDKSIDDDVSAYMHIRYSLDLF